MATDSNAVESAQDAPEENPSYRFAPNLIEQQGRPLGVVLGGRLCDAAKAKAKGNLRNASYAELRRLFRSNCADQEGYLSPQHPVVETVLRLLLTSKADALTLDEIHSRVSDLWLQSTWPRHIARESLRRVLDHAAVHGITPVE